jgi:zinc protease
MRLSAWMVVLLGLFLVIQTVFGAESDSVIRPYTKVTLENGLTVIVKEVHTAPIAAIDIWVATGAKNEAPEEAGISHFFEHMLFKGTTQRKVGEIAKEINGVGGYLNAATSLDTTHYYVVVPSEHIDLALSVQADAIMNSTFDPEEIERERQVILEEKRLKEDDPQARLVYRAYQAVFKGTPYANDVLGDRDTLGKIKRDTFLKYYQKHYAPGNMAVVIVGDVDTEQVIEQARTIFKDFKPGEVLPEPAVTVPDLHGPVRLEESMAVDQTYIYYAYPAPKANHADEAALTVLAVVLGEGKGSLLHQRILEEQQLVMEIQAGYQTFRQVGLFGIFGRTQGTPVEKITGAVNAIIETVIQKGVSKKELDRAKALIESEISYAMESNANIAAIIGEYQIGGGLENIDRYIKAIEHVTVDDLQRVAKKYLDSRQSVITVVRPMEVQ